MSYSVQIVDMAWKKVKALSLPTSIFNDEVVNEGLIHEYVVMYLANQRQSTAHTKTRWEVQRSGRKLYRQKGTWRARVGDAGSPIRRKWWVVFGPRNTRNWAKTMPQKMRNRALCWSLTLKAKWSCLFALEEFTSKEMKTKDAALTLSNMSLGGTKVLLVLPEHNETIERSFRNIPTVSFTTSKQLNAYDVMTVKNIVFVGDAVEQLESRLAK